MDDRKAEELNEAVARVLSYLQRVRPAIELADIKLIRSTVLMDLCLASARAHHINSDRRMKIPTFDFSTIDSVKQFAEKFCSHE